MPQLYIELSQQYKNHITTLKEHLKEERFKHEVLNHTLELNKEFYSKNSKK